METQIVDIKRIVADPSQPRKLFDAAKLNLLRESIKREGIISPLVVEQRADGSLFLIDGERRFRAATELGLTEVPVIIEEERSETQRLIRQFNIQEQHESWTPVEKALAITNIANKLGASVRDVCTVSGVSATNATKYVAFAALLSKEAFISNDVPLDFAPFIRSLAVLAHKLVVNQLEEKFTHEDEAALERRVIESVRSGVIVKKAQLTQLRDAFTKDPKVIRTFIQEANISPEQLFVETKAKGARLLRNGVISSRYVATNLTAYLQIRDVPITDEVAATLRNTRDVINQVLDLRG